MKRYYALLAAIFLACFETASAQPIIDGSLGSDAYGTSLSVQNTDTAFGNATFQPDPVNSGGGSEIDQVFGAISGGRLNVLIAGNLEMNFNKLMVFIDSGAGGVNQLVGANLPTQFDPFCGRCGGGFPSPKGNGNASDGGLQNMNGLTFDAGFTADYALAFTHGHENG
jgi:hypothetical protein